VSGYGGEYPADVNAARKEHHAMLILGIVLLLIGLLTGVALLWTIGLIFAVVGAVLWLLGAAGHQVGGRAHYF
jgi:membrane protein implicated in regulation of membrane protease activity